MEFIALPFLVLLLLLGIGALLLLILNIWMLIDALRRKNWNNGTERLVWIGILAAGIPMAFGTVASVVYYYAVYRPLGPAGR